MSQELEPDPRRLRKTMKDVYSLSKADLNCLGLEEQRAREMTPGIGVKWPEGRQD